MKKKGLTVIALLFYSIVLHTMARDMLNRDVMDYMPRRSQRHSKFSPAEIFKLDMVSTISFNSISTLLDGTLGWANTIADGTGSRSVVIGKIYIRGLYLPQGNTWVGRVYPTGKIVIIRGRSYPFFQLHPVKK